MIRPKTFCGMETPLDEANVIVYGAPFDGTTSFRPGTRFAPEHMRSESWGLETYSPYLDLDLEDYRVADGGDLDLPPGDVGLSIAAIEHHAGTLLAAEVVPLMLGGEHSLTLGQARAVIGKYPDVHLVHFDAHTDLREDYYGQPLSHASVIRRIADLMPPARMHSFGIRSGLKEEFAFAKANMDFHPFSLDGVPTTLEAIGEAPIYLTIDLDVLDPSVFPGTGTPEPGGVSFLDVMQAIHRFRGKRVVAADLMELSPPLDASGASTAVACKLLRELCLVIAANRASEA